MKLTVLADNNTYIDQYYLGEPALSFYIEDGSMSASLEESSDFRSSDARCSVRVFERYSYAGGNRVSLSVTLFQNGDGPISLSAITAGGSQALFFKVNTWGEEAFLDKLRELL